ncbi:MAG: hypothetical protein QHH07_07640 [Sedimentisphaerales bacterium]|nr:hypothetical protein [Sedimentisphaerales bacterium]
MAKNVSWIVGMVLLTVVPARAVVPFGPPRAVIGAGHFTFGGDYITANGQMSSFGLYKEGYVDGTVWYCKYNQLQIQDLEIQAALGSIGYGLGDSWDLIARVGTGAAKGKVVVPDFSSSNAPPTDFFNPGTKFDLDHGNDLAWGIGSRMTFAETGDLALGTVLQVLWLSPKPAGVRFKDPQDSTITISGDADLSYWEVQLGIGATLNLGTVWVYGGPFLYFSKGTFKLDGTWQEQGWSPEPIIVDHDIRDQSNIGGFGGLHWNASDNVGFYVEGQYLSDGWAVGGGGLIRVK